MKRLQYFRTRANRGSMPAFTFLIKFLDEIKDELKYPNQSVKQKFNLPLSTSWLYLSNFTYSCNRREGEKGGEVERGEISICRMKGAFVLGKMSHEICKYLNWLGRKVLFFYREE